MKEERKENVVLEKLNKFASEKLVPLFEWTYGACRLMFRGIFRRVQNAARFVWGKLYPKFRVWGDSALRRSKKFLSTFDEPLHTICHGFHLVARNYRRATEEKGRFNGFFYSFKTLFEGMRNNKELVRRMANYAVPFVLIAALFVSIASVQNVTFAVAVNYNGENIGYIVDETVFDEAEKMMQDRIAYQSKDDVISIVPQYNVGMTTKDDLLTPFQLADRMIHRSNLDIVQAMGVYVDNKFYGAVEHTTELQAALQKLLEPYTSDSENEVVAFDKKVEYRSGLYLEKSMVGERALIDLFTSQKQAERNYTVKEGDSPYSIAQENGISLKELYALNPGIEKSCFVGDIVVLSHSVPFLSVRVSRTEVYDEEIPFKTVEVQDASYPKGVRVVKQEGVKGKRHVKATVEYVDGVEVDRTILESEVTKEPVTQKIAVGTAELIQQAPSGSISGSGQLLYPCPSGYTSQEFGNYGHKGMDIAAPYGSTIYASAGGTVTMSKWYANYGKCVMIDHGNGFVTLYAHCSSLYVSPGQKVGRGEPIAAVGSTGWSTGNHVHWEVRYNGGKYNPRKFM